MAGGEPRLGTTATYMRHNDHGTTHLSTEIDILHDLINDEYRVFSAGSVRKWSKFGLNDVARRGNRQPIATSTNRPIYLTAALGRAAGVLRDWWRPCPWTFRPT